MHVQTDQTPTYHSSIGQFSKQANKKNLQLNLVLKPLFFVTTDLVADRISNPRKPYEREFFLTTDEVADRISNLRKAYEREFFNAVPNSSIEDHQLWDNDTQEPTTPPSNKKPKKRLMQLQLICTVQKVQTLFKEP